MRKVVEDTILIFALHLFNQIENSWVIFYPYLGSYLIAQNNSMKMDDLYLAMFFLSIGVIVGDTLIPFLFNSVPTRFMFLGAAFAFALTTLFFLRCISTPLLFLNTLLAGATCQVFFMGTLTYLQLKYQADGSKSFGIASCGNPIGLALLILFIEVAVNPQNGGMDYQGFGDYTFDPDVIAKTPRIFQMMSFGMIVIGILVAWKLDNITPAEVAASEVGAKSSRIVDMEKYSVDPATNQLVETLTGRPYLETPILQLVTQFKFVFLFAVNVIHYLSVCYVADNYHYIAGFVVRDDTWSINVYFVSTLASLFGRFTSGFFWNQLGIDKIYLLAGVGGILTALMYFLWGSTNAMAFSLLIFWVRYFSAATYLWVNNALFVVYRVTDAMRLVKFYDLYFMALYFLNNVLHRLLTGDHNFRPIFAVFLFIETGGLVLYLAFRQRFLAELSRAKPDPDTIRDTHPSVLLMSLPSQRSHSLLSAAKGMFRASSSRALSATVYRD